VTHGLEAEDVAYQRGEYVDDRSFLEQVDRVGDEGIVGLVVARYVFDCVGTALVIIQIRQEIGPDRGPGTG
jgi:hypothetical protein